MEPEQLSVSPSQKLLFLSDVHLGGFSRQKNLEIERNLLALLDFCLEEDYKIFVLGDLFDYWMEYPNYHPEIGRRVRQRFERYNQAYGPTPYITGNHDNWTGSYFSDIGFKLLHDYLILNIQELKVLLLHGDGTLDNENNLHRPALHRFLRNKNFVKWYQRLLPPKVGLTIMQMFSKLNRTLSGHQYDEELLNTWAKEKLEHSNEDYIICGHDHIPRIKNFPFGTYLNLGTFYDNLTLATHTNGSFDLVVWDKDRRQLTNYYASTDNYG